MAAVKVRPAAGRRRRERGTTRISAKNQITIPIHALRSAGLKPGDHLRVDRVQPGRIVLVRTDDLIRRYAGILTGVYPKGYLKRLRREWRA